ncbi:uncharacterized protein LOC108738721 isoform X4 [Agrilus planipennis]|uniref:Uncharacterized protein LOC108738721 isoform X4 n=1 Tax=Agrilus planipennis TaxID=224129 RepID=A0A1W4X4N9_AGRPL|nr:uncharacterized protein LOC108738721 isoform X4 [Agrilus planipennis]
MGKKRQLKKQDSICSSNGSSSRVDFTLIWIFSFCKPHSDDDWEAKNFCRRMRDKRGEVV